VAGPFRESRLKGSRTGREGAPRKITDRQVEAAVTRRGTSAVHALPPRVAASRQYEKGPRDCPWCEYRNVSPASAAK
jgi:hypothetical protein